MITTFGEKWGPREPLQPIPDMVQIPLDLIRWDKKRAGPIMVLGADRVWHEGGGLAAPFRGPVSPSRLVPQAIPEFYFIALAPRSKS